MRGGLTPGSSVEVDEDDATADPTGKKASATAKTAKELEEEKRKKAQEQMDRYNTAYANWYRSQHGLLPFQNIYKSIDPKTGQPLSSMPLISNPYSALLKDGRYPSQILSKRHFFSRKKTDSDWDFIIQNGQISFSRRARNGKDFKKMYGELMDILAGGRGVKSIKIEWKNEKHITKKRLLELMEMAKQRGLEVEFGPNVKKFIASNNIEGLWSHYSGSMAYDQSDHTKPGNTLSAEKVRKKEMELDTALKDLNKTSTALASPAAFKIEEEKLLIRGHKESLAKLGPSKDDGALAAWKATTGGLSIDERIKELNKEIAVAEQRSKLLEDVSSDMQNQADSFERRIAAATNADEFREVNKHYTDPDIKDQRDDFLIDMQAEQARLTKSISVIKEILDATKATASPEQKTQLTELEKRRDTVDKEAQQVTKGMQENMVRIHSIHDSGDDPRNIAKMLHAKVGSPTPSAPGGGAPGPGI